MRFVQFRDGLQYAADLQAATTAAFGQGMNADVRRFLTFGHLFDQFPCRVVLAIDHDVDFVLWIVLPGQSCKTVFQEWIGAANAENHGCLRTIFVVEAFAMKTPQRTQVADNRDTLRDD